MDLEPKFASGEDREEDGQYADMQRRFSIGVVFSVPLLALTMGPMIGIPIHHWLADMAMGWLQLALATPVVF